MTDQASLERGYRRLLAWYRRAFRRENGQEIFAVLMACAPDGQRRPGLAGLASVWMLWRPASTAFFKPHGLTRVPPARPRLRGQPPRLL